MKTKTLKEYLEIDYAVTFKKFEEGYEAWHEDLGRGSVFAYGDTIEEAIENLNSNREVTIRHLFNEGKEIPIPKAEGDKIYSGQFVVRTSSTLHEQLSNQAQEEGISLNLLINNLLSESNSLFSVKKLIDSLQINRNNYNILIKPTVMKYDSNSVDLMHSTYSHTSIQNECSPWPTVS